MASPASTPQSVPGAPTAEREGSQPARYAALPQLSLHSPVVVISALLCAICIACVPWTYDTFDVADCWLNWALATHGTTPWAAYSSQPECNYPSFVLYMLTLIEKIRLATHAPVLSSFVLALIKLPNILSILGGAATCWYGLRARLGVRYAATAAIAYLLCATLWFNGCVWGQYDAVLCLGMVAAIVALINDRPGWCGIALGLALTVKVQAVIIVPALGIYWLRRSGWAAAFSVAGAAIAMIAVFSVPFFLAGGGHGLILSYIGAVGFYHELQMGAYNGWYLVQHVLSRGLHLAHPDSDETKLFHLLSFKQAGLLTFGGYTLFLLYGLWTRPTRYNGVLACVMGAFAFFMLPTEIHERYIVPAVAISALLIPATANSRTRSAYALFLGLNVSALIGQLMHCMFNHGPITSHIKHLQKQLELHYHIGVPVALFNIGLFIWASIIYYREVYQMPSDAADLFAPVSGAPKHTASEGKPLASVA